MKFYLLAVSSLVAGVLADTCNHDNVLRCLLASSAVASPYCSSYLSIPVITNTATTTTPVTTTTATSLTTLTRTSLTTTSTTTTTSITITTLPAPTVTVGPREEQLDVAELDILARAATSPMPNCLTQSSSMLYPASRISSACSCLSVSTSTISITATAPTSYVTASTLSTVSTTTTTTVITTATDTSTSTADVSTPPPCPSADVESQYGYSYIQYYTGSGCVENPVNPGNDNTRFPPLTMTIPGSESACEAIHDCATFAGESINVYYSFDLHYLFSVGSYQCTIYYDGGADASYFNVPDPDATLVYGYNINF